MPLRLRRAVLLVKLETVYGTDPVPTGGANAILVRNLNVTPLQQQVEDRALVRPYLGNSDRVQTGEYFQAEFEVEVAGAGAAGTVPKFGPCLRLAGFSETVAAGVDVTYAPVSSNFESGTVYVNIDGVLHKSTGGAMDVAISLDSGKIPFFKFTFTGLFVPVVDGAAPAPVYTGFQKPRGVNKANTTLSMHGFSAVVEKLQLAMKNEVPYRNLINTESVTLNDRKPDGSISMEAVTVATKDWFGTIRAGTTGAMSVVHGTTAGNIVEFAAPAAQLFNPRFSDSQGIAMLDTELVFAPGSSGNDELTIKVK